MKVLIVGSGAREHAIGEKILLNETVEKLYFAPGNAGTSKIGKNVSIAANEIDELLYDCGTRGSTLLRDSR